MASGHQAENRLTRKGCDFVSRCSRRAAEQLQQGQPPPISAVETPSIRLDPVLIGALGRAASETPRPGSRKSYMRASRAACLGSATMMAKTKAVWSPAFPDTICTASGGSPWLYDHTPGVPPKPRLGSLSLSKQWETGLRWCSISRPTRRCLGARRGGTHRTFPGRRTRR